MSTTEQHQQREEPQGENTNMTSSSKEEEEKNKKEEKDEKEILLLVAASEQESEKQDDQAATKQSVIPPGVEEEEGKGKVNAIVVETPKQQKEGEEGPEKSPTKTPCRYSADPLLSPGKRQPWMVNPVLAQIDTMQRYSCNPPDWSSLDWNRPELQALKNLSTYSCHDMLLSPGYVHHDDTGTNARDVPVDTEITKNLQSHLSPLGRHVEMIPLRKVDPRKNLAEVPIDEMLQPLQATEGFCAEMNAQSQLLGLSDYSLEKDMELLRLVSSVAENHTDHIAAHHIILQAKVRNVSSRNNVSTGVKDPSSAAMSSSAATMRNELIRTHPDQFPSTFLSPPKDPNKSFYASDVVNYHNLLDEVNAASGGKRYQLDTISNTLSPPRMSSSPNQPPSPEKADCTTNIRHEGVGQEGANTTSTAASSMHDVDYVTWGQRYLDQKLMDEPDEQYEWYREELINWSGRLAATEERLATMTLTGQTYREQHKSPETSPHRSV